MRGIIIATGIILIYAFAAFAQAPQVVQVTPTQNEVSAALTADITAAFDIDMDPATIDDSTFAVYSRTYGYLAGTISYDQPSRTATFAPTRDFFRGDVVTATLTAGIGSLGGTPMDRGFSWTFTVVAEGSGEFNTCAEYPLVLSNSIYIADLNSDDYPDIIAGNLSVFLNDGDGASFTDSIYPYTAYGGLDIAGITAADYDRDGDIDIAVATEWIDMAIMMNNGDGTFGPYVAYEAENRLYGIYSADIDEDSDIDIIVSGKSTQYNLLYMWINDGYGIFTLDSSYVVISNPFSIYAADFNNDGATDIASAIKYPPFNMAFLINDGYGVFITPLYYPFEDHPNWVVGSDLNHDNFVDLAVALSGGSTAILFNNGSGIFDSRADYFSQSSVSSVFASDLNGDHSIDLVSSFGCVDTPSINTSLYYNNGDGTFALHSYFLNSICELKSIFTSDLDLDGDLDIVTAGNSVIGKLTILRNLPGCGYVTGDVNDDGGYNGLDVVYAVNYFKGGNPPPYDECDCLEGGYWFVAGDVNASCNFNGLDVTYGVAYFKGGPAPQPCPSCPPAL